jgi:hypothetical protein
MPPSKRARSDSGDDTKSVFSSSTRTPQRSSASGRGRGGRVTKAARGLNRTRSISPATRRGPCLCSVCGAKGTHQPIGCVEPIACEKHYNYHRTKLSGLSFSTLGSMYHSDVEIRRQVDLSVEGNAPDGFPAQSVSMTKVAIDEVFFEFSLLTDQDVHTETGKEARKVLMKNVPRIEKLNPHGVREKYWVFPRIQTGNYPVWRRGSGNMISLDTWAMEDKRPEMACQADMYFNEATEKRDIEDGHTGKDESDNVFAYITIGQLCDRADGKSASKRLNQVQYTPPSSSSVNQALVVASAMTPPTPVRLPSFEILAADVSPMMQDAEVLVDSASNAPDSVADVASNAPDETERKSSFAECSVQPRSLANGSAIPLDGSATVQADVAKALAWMDLWAAMRDGKVGVARHQAKMGAKRLREKGELEAANCIDSWCDVHEKAECLSSKEMMVRSREEVNDAVTVLMKEFDSLPNEVNVRLVAKELESVTANGFVAGLTKGQLKGVCCAINQCQVTRAIYEDGQLRSIWH